MLAGLEKAIYYYLLKFLPAKQQQSVIRTLTSIPPHLRLRRLYGLGVLERPYYYLGVRRALDISNRLGIDEFSITEFGVAEGNGILYLQNIVDILLQDPAFKHKKIHIYGFDTFEGLPALHGKEDGGTWWKAGDFPSDFGRLASLLNPERVQLVRGLFSDGIAQVKAALKAAPPLFISVDCDFYTSTMSIFDGVFPDLIPPLSYWYFDDVRLNFHSDRVGERLAMKQFNEREGNYYHFVSDYDALMFEKSLPIFYSLTKLYYCVNDETYTTDKVREKKDVQRATLDPERYTILQLNKP